MLPGILPNETCGLTLDNQGQEVTGDKLFEQPDNATPIRANERRWLRIPVFDRRQLNEAEAINVAAGRAWAMKSRKAWWTNDFVCALHRHMFGDVWKWAGHWRDSEVNIGNTPAYMVETATRQVMDDAKFWIENGTYTPHEIAVRLHHRLVQVHPFTNGNGRCTRAMADIVVRRLRRFEPLTWGGGDVAETDRLRTAYIAALKAADSNDYKLLITFAQS